MTLRNINFASRSEGLRIEGLGWGSKGRPNVQRSIKAKTYDRSSLEFFEVASPSAFLFIVEKLYNPNPTKSLITKLSSVKSSTFFELVYQRRGLRNERDGSA